MRGTKTGLLTISDYPLEKLVKLPVVVISLKKGKLLFDVSDLQNKDLRGKAVLFHSGKSEFFGKPEYAKNPPYLTSAAAEYLIKQHAAFVRIDALLVDNYNKNDTIPVHDLLLKNGLVIAEDMTNIATVVGKEAYLTAAPLRVPMASFPARIFAAVY